MTKIRSILFVFAAFSLLFAVMGCDESQQTSTAKAGTVTTEAMTTNNETDKIYTPSVETATKTKTTDVKSVKSEKAASIEFEKALHDFGIVGPGKYVSCEFKFKNVGNDVLKMTKKPHAPCRCTVPKLDKMEYEPGETGAIKVTFHTLVNEATAVKHFTVYSNDPENPETKLTIKAQTVLAVSAEPKRFELNLKDENGGIKPIIVKSKDGKEFSIKEVTSTNKAITVKFDPEKKATEFVLEPVVDMEIIGKQVSGNVNINITHPDTGQLLLTYSVKQPFKVTNQRIFLLKPDPDKPEIRDITILSNYGDPVEIESMESTKGYIEVLEQKKRNNSVTLKVKVTPPPKTEGIRAFYDIMTIKLKGGQEVKITTSGTYPYTSPKPKPEK